MRQLYNNVHLSMDIGSRIKINIERSYTTATGFHEFYYSDAESSYGGI